MGFKKVFLTDKKKPDIFWFLSVFKESNIVKKKTILRILSIIFLLVAIGCGVYLANYYYTSAKTEAVFDELANLIVPVKDAGEESKNTEFVDIDGVKVQKKFEKLYQKNHDFVGWIKIDDTHIDYPVMYSPNDGEKGEYYIHRDFEEKYSAAGLPFIDSNCEIEPATDNIIIYGHNMNAGTMFHDIIKYEDREFYESHKSFSFDTIYGNAEYEIIAMFYGQILDEASPDFKYYEFVNAGSEVEFMDFVNNVKAMSIINTEVDVKYGDKLITLSTCAYHVKDGRFAVVARRKI